jgi:Ras-related protein Rab-8A
MTSETDMTFKILTIGESGVGKTCIAQRFVKDKFNKNHLATIGVDYFDKKLHINNKDVRLKIWDTAGQERFKTLTAQYYKGADGILLVYDVTDDESYEKIRDWMAQIRLNTQKDDIGLVLLGNKCDLHPRKVTKEMGDKLGEELKIKYFETSALSGQGINESFEELTRIIMKKRGVGEGNKVPGGVNLNKKPKEDGCQCC